MTKKIKNNQMNYFYFIVACAVIITLTFFIYPLDDDWYYCTAPNTQFNLMEAFKPTAVFWRPFDAIFGGLIGKAPFLFPYINRIAVALSHILSAFFLDKILIILDYKKIPRFFSVIMFTFSPATIAVVASPDALNQSFSVLFGVLGTYLYLRKNNFLYLLFVAISVLWKESGIIFLAVTPLIGFMKNVPDFDCLKKGKKQIKKLLICAAVAIVFVALYFSVRFYLYGGIALGKSYGRYKISVFSLSSIINFSNMLLLSMTGIDSTAVLMNPKNYLLAGITALLSIAFIIYLLICFVKMIKVRKDILSFVIMTLVIILLAAPQAIIEKAGEMHAYPVLFGVSIMYGLLLNYSEKKNIVIEYSLILCFFTAFAVSSTHKYVLLYKYSEQTKCLNDELYDYYKDNSEELILINISTSESGYSVFYQEPVVGTFGGQSLKQYFNWEKLNIKKYTVKNNNEAKEIAKSLKTDKNTVLIINKTSVTEQK